MSKRDPAPGWRRRLPSGVSTTADPMPLGALLAIALGARFAVTAAGRAALAASVEGGEPDDAPAADALGGASGGRR